MTATSLLSATLKFEGAITLQIQGDGPLKLAVIHGNQHQQIRGIARLSGDIATGCSFREMTGNGVLAITITPAQGERYQGVVSLTGATLTTCLEEYFKCSEQLPTRLFIHTRFDEAKPGAAGILLQTLPAASGASQLEHLAALTATLNTDELLDLPVREVLWRLYHQEEVTVFDPQPVSFHCDCCSERYKEVLKTLPAHELNQLLAENNKIDIDCHYCGSHYVYDIADIAALHH